ncbi:VanZ family protein [Niallia sp.]|uniref:VanZ family protein n=1 Tax=Niallia sp. TaxID=2837523 RepID=UPI00289EBC5A|nr:VanZ family protein [Niallia sp.]
MHVLKNGIFFIIVLFLFITLWSMSSVQLLLNFPFILTLVVPLWIYFRIQQHNQRQNIPFTREFILNLFFFYILTVIYVTLEPFHFTPPNLNEGKMNLVPYVQILYQYKYKPPFFWMLYTLGNILLFIPFGLLLPFLYKKRFRTLVTLGLAVLCSFSIELIQFFFTVDRAADIDDFILNTFGAMVGYFLFLMMRLFVRRLYSIK